MRNFFVRFSGKESTYVKQNTQTANAAAILVRVLKHQTSQQASPITSQ